MTTYTALFRTAAEYAEHDFEADSPQQALQMARDLWMMDAEPLDFEGYDNEMPLDEIEISGPEGAELAVWQSDDLCLRLAARELLEALKAVEPYLPTDIDDLVYGKFEAALAKATPDTQTS